MFSFLLGARTLPSCRRVLLHNWLLHPLPNVRQPPRKSQSLHPIYSSFSRRVVLTKRAKTNRQNNNLRHPKPPLFLPNHNKPPLSPFLSNLSLRLPNLPLPRRHPRRDIRTANLSVCPRPPDDPPLSRHYDFDDSFPSPCLSEESRKGEKCCGASVWTGGGD